ncbi:VOC family protein [Solimicrobium silvestre]|uniref:Glyoxalase-like domain n=1 Tax=Solimicrobium silvestre TaxID=2099400 RepID=A0A2S9GSZ9_9BURK|nr:VOC family protein [Solimicrobium silvestre]PRC90818.1 Glyoxalase-like domain [Solimicrobium silvestre]
MYAQDNSIPTDAIPANKDRQRRVSTCRKLGFFKHNILAAFIGAAIAMPALSADLSFPALVTPASQEHHVGKIVFVELVTPNLVASKQFYGGLFGWTFRDIHTGGREYVEASMDGRPVAGLIYKAIGENEHKQPAWLSFIAVSDVDAAKRMAVEHGAKVLFEPHNIPNRGREAVFADPQGAVFAILASSSGDPADVIAAPGEWIWSSLITVDPGADAAFYQTLFNYEVFDLPAAQGFQHLMLASDDYARASINSLPADKAITPPHWLNYVRVDDTVKMAAKVVALGGKILVAPRIDRHGGKVAVVADTSGAPFGLIEWPNTERKEVMK